MAIEAYNAFHDSIEHAIKNFDGKPGFLLDFHGYYDKNRWIIFISIPKIKYAASRFHRQVFFEGKQQKIKMAVTGRVVKFES